MSKNTKYITEKQDISEYDSVEFKITKRNSILFIDTGDVGT